MPLGLNKAGYGRKENVKEFSLDTEGMEAELKKSLDIDREMAAQMNHHPKQLKEKKKAKKGDVTAKSNSSSVLELHNKLNEVESPSSSKPDDDEVYGPEMDEEQLGDEVS